ncbi:hypothetical protein OJF2_22460 [Aquisphaera giovannonii]|uniref:Uncharacterized protein n=1 Tax=Aquisphaera giovannonii TaxID=406548 RepID=A0A5B9W192_9BACT|nr:hypothetical protein [Aquisphaera giovannonii]QEH33740.1 hypothetical protein OJF2_22460 [Aquisphaera giovannonii]
MFRYSERPSCRFRGTLLGTMALGAAVMFGCGTTARAQGYGPDPFRPYNSQYNAYIYPVAPSMNYGYNNAPPVVGSAGGYQNYLDSLSGMANGRGGAAVPYNQANRAYDEQFGRIYRPNREADAQFERRQQKANDIYFQYFREKDPKRRAQLLRDYNRARTLEERDAGLAGGAARTRAVESGRARGEAGAARDPGADLGPPAIGGSRSAARRGSGLPVSSAARRAPRPSSPTRAASPSTVRGRKPEDILDRAKATEAPEGGPPPAVAPRRRGQDGPPPID